MIPRFHCPFPLAPGAQVDLPDTAAYHALKVLRMKAGDSMILFDGRGGEWRAELLSAKVSSGETARVALREFNDRDVESPVYVTLVQALPSGDKMDWVVEKSVELGVAAIQPVASKRSVIRLSAERMAKRVAHWNAIASAACEQCGRNHVPLVAPVLDLPQYLAKAMAQNARRLLLAPEGQYRLASPGQADGTGRYHGRAGRGLGGRGTAGRASSRFPDPASGAARTAHRDRGGRRAGRDAGQMG